MRRARRRTWWATAPGWCTLAGVLTFLSFPNWNLYPLAFVALAPLVLVSERLTVRGAFFAGWWTGTVTNAGGFYWLVGMMVDFASSPVVVGLGVLLLCALQQGLVYGLAAALARWTTLRAPGWTVLAWAAALPVAETAMIMVFPWRLGHALWRFPLGAQLAEVGGVALLSALLAAVAASLGMAWRSRRDAPWRHVGVAAGLLALMLGYGAVRMPMVERAADAAPTLRIGMVEADIGIDMKGQDEALAENLLTHQRLSAELEADGADLIIWPETAFQPAEPTARGRTRFFQTREPAESLADARAAATTSPLMMRDATWLPASDAPLPASADEDVQARRATADVVAPQRGFRTPLLLGAIVWSRASDEERADSPVTRIREHGLHIHNSAILLDAEGRVLGAFDKNVRMPFTEQVPLGHEVYRALGLNLYEVVPMAGHFFRGVPGEGLRLPTEDGEGAYRLGVTICYEGILPSFFRKVHAQRPHALINLTNDAWFGKTAEPWLHLALSSFRSIEQRTAFVRATNTGVSAFFSPTGRMVSHTSIYDAETLAWDTPMLEATTTPYMALGEWVPPLGALTLLLLAWLAGRRRRLTPPELVRPELRDEAEREAGEGHGADLLDAEAVSNGGPE